VLNTLVRPEDVPFYGVPFPGYFLVNEEGVIVDKIFNRHFANRETVESIVDSSRGRIVPGEREPIETVTEVDGIEITAFLRGGGGVLRIGPRRRLVVRFAMPDGLHIYSPSSVGLAGQERVAVHSKARAFSSPEAPAKVSTGSPMRTSTKPTSSSIFCQPAHGRPPAIHPVQRSISVPPPRAPGCCSRCRRTAGGRRGQDPEDLLEGAFLSGQRLNTPLEITTSAHRPRRAAPRGSPERNSTLSAPSRSALRRALSSISSVMSTPTTWPSLADLAGGDERVEPRPRTDVDDLLAGLESP
jgi:hypothetical protein